MKKMLHILFAIALFAVESLPQPGSPAVMSISPAKLNQPKLVEQFYKMNDRKLFWFGSHENAMLRSRLVSLLDSAAYLALNKNNYHHEWMSTHQDYFSPDTAGMIAADKIYTDAAISFCKDIYQGHGVNNWVSYDELSRKCEDLDNDFILVGLSCISSVNELEWFIHFLEPLGKDYFEMKQALRSAMDSSLHQKIKPIERSLNLLRWLKHFGLDRYVVVNTASAIVRYYEWDTVKLRMKAVVGTVATPTPSFAGICNAVVLYPYWNVPNSIAVNEILPLVKKNPSYLDRRGLQVINASGKILDPYSINWSNVSSKHFPYQFRQSTGCDNALGVMKFNLTDPYSVYMHDTNNKNAFFAGARYFSHGCIRLEKPVELANEFLPGQIDEAFLEACYKNQKPLTLSLEVPIPVFVIYMTAEYDEDKAIHFYKDVYKLLR